jgi:electron transport complex protein RnfG
MMKKAISNNAFLLAAAAIICTGAVAIVNQLTQPIIAQQEQKALLRTLNQLIPENLYDNDIVASCFTVTDKTLLGSEQPRQVFIAKKAQNDVALMIETNTMRGYSGEIKLVVGIFEDGSVAGVRVISHTETPGLGDKIQTNKSNWIESFTNKSYQESKQNLWDVKKNGGDFDAFTGATITPRSVIFAVKDTLIYFEQNKQQLFSHPATCGESK